jgi:hypothetical protein
MLPRLLGWQSLPRDKSEALLLGQGTFEEHMWYCGFVREQKLGLNLEVDAFLRLLLVLVDDFVRVPWAGCWCQLMTAIQEHQIVSHKFGEVCIDIGFWRCALTTIPEQKRVKAGATAKHRSHTISGPKGSMVSRLSENGKFQFQVQLRRKTRGLNNPQDWKGGIETESPSV